MARPWYPFYWSDYSGKTFNLTQGQHGAYLLFLRQIYTTGQPIPVKQCYSIAKAMTEQEREDADLVLREFFRNEGDGWVNDRALEIMQDAEIKHEKRVLAGSIGGKQRSSNAKAMLNQPQPQPQPEYIYSTQDKFLSGAEPEITHSRDDFDEFWDAYPLKTRKNDAEIAFDVAVNKGVLPADLIRAAKSYAESDLSDGKGSRFKYAKNPTDWLRDERYRDFLPKVGEMVKVPVWLSDPRIVRRFDGPTITNWLSKLQYVNGGEVVTLTAPDKLTLKWVKERYLDDLQAAIGQTVELVSAPLSLDKA